MAQTDIYLVGADALTEAVECVSYGDITGTVFNDYYAQSHRAAEAAINYLTGVGNEHSILSDYVKITRDNAPEILAILNADSNTK